MGEHQVTVTPQGSAEAAPDPIVQALHASLDPAASQATKREAIQGLALFRETTHGAAWAVRKLQAGGDDLEVAFAATVLESAVSHWPRLDPSQRRAVHDTLWLSLPVYWRHSRVVYSRSTAALCYLSCIEWDSATWARIRGWVGGETTVEMGLDFLTSLLDATAGVCSTAPESFDGKVPSSSKPTVRARHRELLSAALHTLGQAVAEAEDGRACALALRSLRGILEREFASAARLGGVGNGPGGAGGRGPAKGKGAAKDAAAAGGTGKILGWWAAAPAPAPASSPTLSGGEQPWPLPPARDLAVACLRAPARFAGAAALAGDATAAAEALGSLRRDAAAAAAAALRAAGGGAETAACVSGVLGAVAPLATEAGAASGELADAMPAVLAALERAPRALAHMPELCHPLVTLLHRLADAAAFAADPVTHILILEAFHATAAWLEDLDGEESTPGPGVDPEAAGEADRQLRLASSRLLCRVARGAAAGALGLGGDGAPDRGQAGSGAAPGDAPGAGSRADVPPRISLSPASLPDSPGSGAALAAAVAARAGAGPPSTRDPAALDDEIAEARTAEAGDRLLDDGDDGGRDGWASPGGSCPPAPLDPLGGLLDGTGASPETSAAASQSASAAAFWAACAARLAARAVDAAPSELGSELGRAAQEALQRDAYEAISGSPPGGRALLPPLARCAVALELLARAGAHAPVDDGARGPGADALATACQVAGAAAVSRDPPAARCLVPRAVRCAGAIAGSWLARAAAAARATGGEGAPPDPRPLASCLARLVDCAASALVTRAGGREGALAARGVLLVVSSSVLAPELCTEPAVLEALCQSPPVAAVAAAAIAGLADPPPAAAEGAGTPRAAAPPPAAIPGLWRFVADVAARCWVPPRGASEAAAASRIPVLLSILAPLRQALEGRGPDTDGRAPGDPHARAAKPSAPSPRALLSAAGVLESLKGAPAALRGALPGVLRDAALGAAVRGLLAAEDERAASAAALVLAAARGAGERGDAAAADALRALLVGAGEASRPARAVIRGALLDLLREGSPLAVGSLAREAAASAALAPAGPDAEEALEAATAALALVRARPARRALEADEPGRALRACSAAAAALDAAAGDGPLPLEAVRSLLGELRDALADAERDAAADARARARVHAEANGALPASSGAREASAAAAAAAAQAEAQPASGAALARRATWLDASRASLAGALLHLIFSRAAPEAAGDAARALHAVTRGDGGALAGNLLPVALRDLAPRVPVTWRDAVLRVASPPPGGSGGGQLSQEVFVQRVLTAANDAWFYDRASSE